MTTKIQLMAANKIPLIGCESNNMVGENCILTTGKTLQFEKSCSFILHLSRFHLLYFLGQISSSPFKISSPFFILKCFTFIPHLEMFHLHSPSPIFRFEDFILIFILHVWRIFTMLYLWRIMRIHSKLENDYN